MTEPTHSSPAASASDDAGGWVTVRIGPAGFHTEATARTHTVVIDEPIPLGGTDQGPTPYEYLLASLGGCTAMTLRFYADRKKWALDSVTVQLRSGHSHERDCEECATKKVGIGHIQRRIELEGTLTGEQRARLLEIADRCPVKQTLEGGIHVEPVER
jgi:uncharacterized OsmC-like protein